TVMGTVAYMSPEQARGEEVDARSDQSSFGLIVYELAAGKRAFARASATETMAAIIRDEAEPLPPSVPAPLRWVVERCLAKDPAERYDSTRDLYRELKHAREHLSESSASGQQAAQPAMSLPRWRGLVTFAALAAACAAGAFFFLRGAHSDPPSFQSLTFRREIINDARFAPDGKTLVYDSTEDGPPRRAERTPALARLVRGGAATAARPAKAPRKRAGPGTCSGRRRWDRCGTGGGTSRGRRASRSDCATRTATCRTPPKTARRAWRPHRGAARGSC